MGWLSEPSVCGDELPLSAQFHHSLPVVLHCFILVPRNWFSLAECVASYYEAFLVVIRLLQSCVPVSQEYIGAFFVGLSYYFIELLVEALFHLFRLS